VADTVRRVDVRLRPATEGERELLHSLLGDYLFEFDGRTGAYPHFDAYWTDENRLPFLIEDDGEVAGLCLIRVLHDRSWNIAEFFVVPPARRHGVGRDAVEAVVALARAAGASYLQAKVHPENTRALAFWTAAGFRAVAANGVTITRRDV
jgi:predicted acetyltransferase